MVSKAPFMVPIDFECFLVSEEQLVLAVPLSLKHNQYLQQKTICLVIVLNFPIRLDIYVNCLLLAIQIKYQALFSPKIKKECTKFVLCCNVIGALRINGNLIILHAEALSSDSLLIKLSNYLLCCSDR